MEKTPLDYERPRQDAVPQMQCPYCGEVMRRGRIVVHGSVLDIFLTFSSCGDVYFRWDDPENKTWMGWSEEHICGREQRAAQQCTRCGTVVVLPK